MNEVIESADDLYHTREVVLDILEGTEKTGDDQMFKEKTEDEPNFNWMF